MLLVSGRRHGLTLLYRFYSRLPFLSEFLSIYTKAIAILQVWHLISRYRTAGEFGVFDGTTFRLSLGAANIKVDSSHSIHLKDCQAFHPSMNQKMFLIGMSTRLTTNNS